MSDVWLSNYSFGDMMERNPIIKLDYSRFENVDAIFISHAHVDHFDPYTFIELYKNVINKPVLLIPNTISYLTPLLDKYLPEQKYIILESKSEIDVK
jgi:Cft2 family RNA processing exonuclease